MLDDRHIRDRPSLPAIAALAGNHLDLSAPVTPRAEGKRIEGTRSNCPQAASAAYEPRPPLA